MHRSLRIPFIVIFKHNRHVSTDYHYYIKSAIKCSLEETAQRMALDI